MAVGDHADLANAWAPDLPVAVQIQGGTAGLMGRTAELKGLNVADHMRRIIEHTPEIRAGQFAVYDAEPLWEGEPLLRRVYREGRWPDGCLDLLAASAAMIRSLRPGAVVGIYGIPMDWTPNMDLAPYLAAVRDARSAARCCDILVPLSYDRTESPSIMVDRNTATQTAVAARAIADSLGLPVHAYVSVFYGHDQGPATAPKAPVPIRNWRARLESLKAGGADGVILWSRATDRAWGQRVCNIFAGEHGQVLREVFGS